MLGPSPDIDELEARAARIVAHLADEPAARCRGDLVVDLLARDAFVTGRAVGLHPRKFALLWRLMQADGEPLGKACLLSEVWHLQHVPGTNRFAGPRQPPAQQAVGGGISRHDSDARRGLCQFAAGAAARSRRTGRLRLIGR
nr:putative two componenet response regulator protein [uncultured bacterium]